MTKSEHINYLNRFSAYIEALNPIFTLFKKQMVPLQATIYIVALHRL